MCTHIMDRPECLFVYSIKLVKVVRKYTLSCICDISFRKIIVLLIFSIKSSLYSGLKQGL